MQSGFIKGLFLQVLKNILSLFQYSYEAATGEYQANVTIVWNRSHHVDTINVTLYKCDILGSHREHPDCSLCVTRNAKYQCTWCGNTCSYSESCMQMAVNECPKPRIDMVSILQEYFFFFFHIFYFK